MTGSLARLVENSVCTAIIGMEKNTGKTTVLNYLLENSLERINAITSIGFDGEDTDQVTQTGKPRIYVGRGTIVATARSLVAQCDFTKEMLGFTGFHTPMGEVIMIRALSDGYAQIAGPSSTLQMSKLVKMLKEAGAERILIDGAAARKSTAAIAMADCCILATGAAFSPDIDHLLTQTVHQVTMLSLPTVNSDFLPPIHDAEQVLANGHGNDCYLIKKNGDWDNIGTSLDENVADTIARQINCCSGLVCDGVVPFRLVDRLLSKTRTFAGFRIIAQDGTRFLISPQQYFELQRRGAQLQVKRSVNLVAVTVNPYAPAGYSLDSAAVCEMLKQHLSIEVFDVFDVLGDQHEGTMNNG